HQCRANDTAIRPGVVSAWREGCAHVLGLSARCEVVHEDGNPLCYKTWQDISPERLLRFGWSYETTPAVRMHRPAASGWRRPGILPSRRVPGDVRGGAASRLGGRNLHRRH